ncbi:unnamed protein product [Paramecium pentaurelia]|uniref:Major facilitator superfamily (MFS) profile domain-containing protein n=1 Tax=Paramecium pentaurelia TaxID=43138 RepID=A0A8S1S1E9_9CILI|nr:unnamed protein product [Paramecium pentaurelia]
MNNKQSELFKLLNNANFIICASMALIAPFYPPFAFEQGLSKTLVGIIIALHPLGGIFGSIKIGELLNDQNRQVMLTGSMIVQAICLFLFILIYLIKSYWFITIISLISRIINGIAYSVFITSFYSYIPFLFPDEHEQKIALAEAASALGYMLGPMIGSILYAIGGFTFPFITFIIFSILCGYYIHNCQFEVTKKECEIEMIEINLHSQHSEPQLEQPLKYLEVLKQYDVYINALMCVMVTTSITINFPLMAQYMQDHYQIEESTVGFYMGLQPMCYTIATILITKIQNPNKPFFMIGFQLLNGLSLFFYGPDPAFTGIERNLLVCCISLALTGVAQSFPLIYSLPQLNESLIELYPNSVKQCNNFASAIFSASISLGEFSGPFIGGFLSNFCDLDRIASITGLLALTLCISYIPFLQKHMKK